MTFIPSTAEDLTAEWVDDALRSVGVLHGGDHVRSIRVAHLSYGGVGLSGDTVRVFLEGEGSGLPASLIAKFPTAVVANRGMIEGFDGYAREIAFYRDLATEVPVRVPGHFGSAMDPARFAGATDVAAKVVDWLPSRAHLALTADITKFMRPTKRRYVLLIEDMGADTVVHDLEEPPSVEQLCEVAGCLADLHASFWGRRDLADHPATRTLVTEIPRVFVNVLRGRCRPIAEARWGAWLTDADRRRLDEATDRFADDLAVINEPHTFVHGDPRSDNILFGAGDPIMLDWAMSSVAHPGYDIGYLLGSSLRRVDKGRAGEVLDAYLGPLGDAGVRLERAELVRGVAASARVGLVLQMNSLAVLEGGYGDNLPADLWLPRLLGLLEGVDEIAAVS